MSGRSAFDAAVFYRRIELVRQERRLNWNQVAEQAGVSASTLTRMKQGRRADIDSMAALARWSGVSLDSCVVGRVLSPSLTRIEQIEALIRDAYALVQAEAKP